MIKCSRCGEDGPIREILVVAMDSLLPGSASMWYLCNDCYGKFLYLMNLFNHKNDPGLEQILEHMPDAWWRVKS